MDWKSLVAPITLAAAGCGLGAALLALIVKWLEFLDARWKARALAAEASNAELQEVVRNLELENAKLQETIDELEARPSAKTILPPDVPPGSGLVTGW